MLIKSLHLKNILSFKDTKLDLQPLNVLIGANGSGKSNLIDAVALLQAVPGDLPAYFRRSGPISDWVWNGDQQTSEAVLSAPEICAVLDTGNLPAFLEYRLGLTVVRNTGHYDVTSENLALLGFPESLPAVVKRGYRDATISNGGLFDPTETGDTVSTADFASLGTSVLGEIRDRLHYPIADDVARLLAAIRFYRSWTVGRHSPTRSPQRTDGDSSFLEEDFSNLSLVVNDLRENQGLGPTLDSCLGRFYETYQSLHTPVFDSMIRLTARETGLSRPIPATRLSDGTIRFIALLAILCHPEPPPLICIEEPEIAMHPDSLGLIAELLRKAAERTQIIVTTHSPELVSLLPPEPKAEFVVVCERDAAEGTRFHRPSYKELREWQDIYQQTGKELVVYGLSEMWMSGALGGVRW